MSQSDLSVDSGSGMFSGNISGDISKPVRVILCSRLGADESHVPSTDDHMCLESSIGRHLQSYMILIFLLLLELWLNPCL